MDKKVKTNLEVPYLAGYSKNGKCIYIDKRLPKKMKLKDGRVVAVDKYLEVHEATEKSLEDSKGYNYKYAHEKATGAERKAVEADGIPWNEYQDYMLNEVKKLTKLDSKVPKDIDEKPEHDYGDKKMIKEIEEHKKSDMVEVEADGKTELVAGNEPLKKDPKARWKKLKKSMDHNKAFMSIEDAMGDGEDQEQEQPAPPSEPEDEEVPEQEEPEEQPEEEQQEEPESEDGDTDAEAEERIIQALRDDGHSDAEIAFIVHGHHSPELSETDAAKAKATNDMSSIDTNHAARQADLEHEHSKRMNDVEYNKAKNEMADPETEKNHRKRMLDLEYETAGGKKKQSEMDLEHKKRMMDLEYGKAEKDSNQEDPTLAMKAKQLEFELEMKRKEKELELEYKKKELELKLKIAEEQAAQKAEHAARQAEEDAKVNAQVKKEQSKHKIAAAKEPPKPAKPAGKK